MEVLSQGGGLTESDAAEEEAEWMSQLRLKERRRGVQRAVKDSVKAVVVCDCVNAAGKKLKEGERERKEVD